MSGSVITKFDCTALRVLLHMGSDVHLDSCMLEALRELQK